MASPKLPPRNKRPKLPAYHPPKVPASPTIYRWGQANPGYAQQPATPSPPVATGIPSTGTNAPVGQPGVPIDPIYSNDLGIAQRTHDTTVSGLYTQRANTAADYGYTPTYDEQGLIRSLAVDPNNPYAKANLLKKSYTESRARNLNSFASRGQLYAGSLGVAQNIADEGYQQGSNALQSAFTRFIANNQGQINATNTDYANALASADSQRVARASANDTGETAPPPPAPAAVGNIPSTPYKKKAGTKGLGFGSR